MTHTLQVPEDRAVFVFSNRAAHLPVTLKATYFEDDPKTPIALEFRTLSQIIIVFLTVQEIGFLKSFFTAPELMPGHCSDC